jgi:hypothetical protein
MSEMLLEWRFEPRGKLAVRPEFGYNTAISFSGDLSEIYKIKQNQWLKPKPGKCTTQGVA